MGCHQLLIYLGVLAMLLASGVAHLGPPFSLTRIHMEAREQYQSLQLAF